MAVGGVSSGGKSGGASGSSSKGNSSGASGSTGATGRTGGTATASKSRSTGTDKAAASPSATATSTDVSSMSKETSATATDEADAKSKAENFESRFSAAFDAPDPETQEKQEALESALQDYAEAKKDSGDEEKSGVLDTAAGLTKNAAEKVADAAKKARKGRGAVRAGRKLSPNLNLPRSVSRFGRFTAGGAAGLSAVTGAVDLATSNAPLNDKMETSLKVADDIASTAQMARSLGATSRFGIGTLGRMAPAIGAGALAFEGVNQLATSQSASDTWSGSLKTAAAGTMVAGMTSVVGAVPAAVASTGMYGAALAIDNWDTIDRGIHAGIDVLQDTFGPEVPRSQDPAFELTARGYRRK